MLTTINIDDALMAKAAKLVGALDRSAVVREGLRALIERESARRSLDLVDTSVWVDHLRLVIGEIACRILSGGTS